MSIEVVKKDYFKIDMLSSSDLRLFATDRKKFYKKNILKEKEEDADDYNRATLIGNLCHSMLLEPELFDEKYLVSECAETPTGLMLKFTEALYDATVNNLDHQGSILVDMPALAQMAWEASGFKISLDAVMKKFAGSTAEQYYNDLRRSRPNNLLLVCIDDLSIANSITASILGDEFVGPIFTIPADNNTIFSEIQVENVKFLGTSMKAMLDRVIVDHGDKTIQLYDLKVVWDNQNFYSEYYVKKLAYIQALVYHTALAQKTVDLGFDYSNYYVKLPIFVVADSSNFYAPVQYKLHLNNMEDAMNGFEYRGRMYKGAKEIVQEIIWAVETNNWRISKEAWDSNGILTLK